MASFAIWRWVLLGMLRSPGVGVLCVLFFSGPLLVARLRPLATGSGPLEVTLAWSHPAGWVGVALALVTLSRGESFLARLDPRTRVSGELGALLLAAIVLQLPILTAALLGGAAPVDLGRAVPAILSVDLQLASVALLLLLPALSTAPRISLFLAAVVLVPALLASDARMAPLVAFLAPGVASDVHAHALWLPRFAVGAALVLVGYLLRTSPTRAPAA